VDYFFVCEFFILFVLVEVLVVVVVVVVISWHFLFPTGRHSHTILCGAR